MNVSYAFKVCVCSALLPLALVGCGGNLKPSNRSEVKGMVSLDGQPLAGAEVKLVSEKSSGFGRTDETGQFQLVQAVPPGQYRVIISKLDGLAAQAQQQIHPAEQGLDAGQMEAISMAKRTSTGQYQPYQAGPKELVPPNFSNLELTQLSIDVPKGGVPNADFKLTSR